MRFNRHHGKLWDFMYFRPSSLMMTTLMSRYPVPDFAPEWLPEMESATSLLQHDDVVTEFEIVCDKLPSWLYHTPDPISNYVALLEGRIMSMQMLWRLGFLVQIPGSGG